MAEFIQYMTSASLYDGPFDDKSGWSAAGMGDIIITKNGRFIVVDGGFTDDAESFVAFLESLSDTKVPLIDYWIITHPHLDHYGVIKEISENQKLLKQLTVKNFVYLFPKDFCDKNGKSNACAFDIEQMSKACRTMNSNHIEPKRNTVIQLDDVKIEFLYVPDDCSILNTAGGNPNLCSLIFTVEGKDKKVMITGDAFRRNMEITSWRYAKKLKCDALQMPHHALCDAYSVDFYRFVDPQIIFMPISKAGYTAMHSELYAHSEGYKVNLEVEMKADTVYKAFEGISRILI